MTPTLLSQPEFSPARTVRAFFPSGLRGVLFAVSFVLAQHGGQSVAAGSDRGKLVGAGLGMAVPTYAIGLVLHESSHALAAQGLGADVTDMSLIPGRHPRTRKFYFGYVSVRGLSTRKAQVLFYLAPKITDAMILAGYGALVATGTTFDNRYANLSLTVLATGIWVDFSRDIFAFWDHNDTVTAYRLMGLTRERQRLPVRLLHAGLSTLGALAIVHSYRDIFSDADGADGSAMTMSLSLPLWNQRF